MTNEVQGVRRARTRAGQLGRAVQSLRPQRPAASLGQGWPRTRGPTKVDILPAAEAAAARAYIHKVVSRAEPTGRNTRPPCS